MNDKKKVIMGITLFLLVLIISTFIVIYGVIDWNKKSNYCINNNFDGVKDIHYSLFSGNFDCWTWFGNTTEDNSKSYTSFNLKKLNQTLKE